ncbi:MAG TPA: GFA family protein [Thermohalobaculum sp.]|nr:GFA family protein [Thermohalobaculum sp.]
MRLEGSCHCGCVRFSLDASSPVPYLRCFCSICRKTAGSAGFGINLGGWVKGMVVEGAKHICVYDPTGDRTEGSTNGSGRRFCGNCGSPLWNWDGRWPDFIHPNAGAIDTPLPTPPAHVDMMLGSAVAWARSGLGEPEKAFNDYPDEALADWHQRHGLTSR